MNLMSRRAMLKGAAEQAFYQLPSDYDKNDYPYSALVQGFVPSGVDLWDAVTGGNTECYAFVCSKKQHPSYGLMGKPNQYMWKGGGNSVHSITWLSLDGKNWTQVCSQNMYALTQMTEVHKKYFDTILRTQ